jgi:hypothetical protein
MEIKINKNNIYDYALSLTARAGSGSDEYAHVAITKDNYPMLEVYLSEAITQAESVLRKKLSNSHFVDMRLQGDDVILKTREQYQADVSVYGVIESSIRLYAAYHIAASWLQPSVASNLAEVFGTTAHTHLEAAASAFNQKKRAQVSEADHGTRNAETMKTGNDASASIAEYSDRTGDNLFARPGMRLVETEVLAIRASEDGEELLPAVSSEGAYLITNP